MEKELPSYLREGRLAMCVLSRQRIIVTLRRVTVSRDDIESSTRKSEVSQLQWKLQFPLNFGAILFRARG